MCNKTIQKFHAVLKLLNIYEKRTAFKNWPITGIKRSTVWYKLTLYSDGSGHVEDTAGGEKILFRFNSVEELAGKITS